MKSNVRLQGTDEKLKDHEDIRDHASQYHDTTKDRECVAAVQSLPHGKTNLDDIIQIYISKDSVSFLAVQDSSITDIVCPLVGPLEPTNNNSVTLQ